MAAQLVAEELGECELIALPQFNTKEYIDAERIGIVCPVYYWGLPNIVRETVSKLNIKSGAYVFGIVTMGGSSGNALPALEKILADSETPHKLSYGASVKCPDNYSTVMGFQKPEKHEGILKEAEEQLSQIAEDIKEQRENQIPKFRRTLEILFASSRKSVWKKDGKFRIEDTCVGCGDCEKNCPVHNIHMENGKPAFLHKCEFCMSCISKCSKSAINVGKRTVGKPRYTNNTVKKS